MDPLRGGGFLLGRGGVRLGGLRLIPEGWRAVRILLSKSKNAFRTHGGAPKVLGNAYLPHNSCKILAIEVEEVNDNCN